MKKTSMAAMILSIIVTILCTLPAWAAPLSPFTATDGMDIARDGATATLLGNGTVLITGGDGFGTAEIFDPGAGTFAATGVMIATRYGHTATLLGNGTVLITGGDDFGTAEIFDPGAGTFAATGAMIAERVAHTATLLGNGTVLITGGDGFGTAEIFDPAGNAGAGTFAPTGAMTAARRWHTATLLGNGKVLIAGSLGVTTAEIFDPAGNAGAGTFAATGAMTAARSSNAATLLVDGTVLITGGDDAGQGSLDTAEIFDPGAGTFAATTGVMTAARTRHTATLLADNTVLIVGGYDYFAWQSLSSAEIYNTTTTTLGSSSNPSAYGASVTFTATIAPAPSDGGTVNFMDGVDLLGTGTLTNGTATLTTSTLTIGSHSITARFIGDSSYGGSISSALTQTVGLKTLSVIPTVTDKVYDGNTTAAVTYADNRVEGDDLTVTAAAAVFADKSVGTGKTVTITGIAISGTDAAKYKLAATTAIVTGKITPKPLTVTGMTAANKVYDGNTTATLSGGTLAGKVGSDVVTILTRTGTFDTKNVGTDKDVTATSIGLSNPNYTVTPFIAAKANITAKPLTVQAGTMTAANKVYDGNTTATLSNGTLNGIVAPDVVTITGRTGTFSTKDVGVGKAVTVTGITLSNSNYTVATKPTGVKANITAKPLTIAEGSMTANNKPYDNTFTATFTGGTLNGIVVPDVVTILTRTGTFASKSVGNDIDVTVTGITLSNKNYNVPGANFPTGLKANITSKPVTVTGMTVTPKPYDGNNTATLTGGRLVGIVSGDVVTITGRKGTFDTKNVGVGKAVTVTEITLSNSSYTVTTMPTGLKGNITAKALTVTDMAADNKEYDRNTTATFTGGTLNGIVGQEVVTIGAVTGTFASKTAANAKPVTVTNITLDGADKASYTVTKPTGLMANITKRSLTVNATCLNRAYNGTTAAKVTYTDNRIAGDVITVTGTAVFEDAEVGEGKTVNVTGIAMRGADAPNYSLSATTASTTADITAKPLTVTGMTVINKTYDGNTTAALNSAVARLSGLVSGKTAVTVTGGVGTFINKNVGTAKAVTVTGITLGGADAAYYTVTTYPTGLKGNITAKPLTVTTTCNDKVYDGNTTATCRITDDDRVEGDIFTESNVVAVFTNKNVIPGDNAVNITGLTISGGDATNYSLVTPITSTANITPKTLTVTGMTAENKVFDDTYTATLSSGTLAGKVGSDVVTILTRTGTFDTKDVADGIHVTVTGITLDDSNYIVPSENYPTDLTANITAPN